MANRNRTAGLNLEREVAQMFRAVGFDKCVTSRAESKNLDDKGIDLCFTGLLTVQCKNTKDLVKYPELIEGIAAALQPTFCWPVVIHKKTKKSNKNFIEQGKYAILRLEDFMTMVKMLKEKGLI